MENGKWNMAMLLEKSITCLKKYILYLGTLEREKTSSD